MEKLRVRPAEPGEIVSGRDGVVFEKLHPTQTAFVFYYGPNICAVYAGSQLRYTHFELGIVNEFIPTLGAAKDRIMYLIETPRR